MENFEIQLVKSAQSGNRQAFEKLVALHDRRVYQLAYSVVGNVHDAQDIYQEVFLRAWSKLSSFSFEGPFAAWLNRIVINLSINRLRQKQRWKWFDISSKDNSNDAWDDGLSSNAAPDPERLAVSSEINSQLNSALEDLPAKQRTIFVMRHCHGLKIKEISAALSCAEGTVKNQLFRATQKLKVHFKKLYNENI